MDWICIASKIKLWDAVIDLYWCTLKSHTCVLCLAFDPFSSSSASMPLALSLKITAEIPMIKLEADFDLCFTVTYVCRESKLSTRPACMPNVSQCSWTVLSTMARWYKVTALWWHFWQGSINTSPNLLYPQDTVDILSHTQRQTNPLTRSAQDHFLSFTQHTFFFLLWWLPLNYIVLILS